MVEHGLLGDNECSRRAFAGVEIGYSHIKQRRARRSVPCGAGGTLADYVPFYFAPRSPMVSAITAGRVSAEAARVDQIVYLVTSVQALRAAGLTIVVSNLHAELGYAEFTDRDDTLDDGGFVDWPPMNAKYWANTPEDPVRKDRRQAECLAHPSVPWNLIETVATKTAGACLQVRDLLNSLGPTTPVAVRPSWYF